MVPLLPVYVAGLFGLVVAVPIQHYATKYDHIDIEMILNNRRMVNHYAACLLSKGPCPPEGLEFKRILPEALRTNCMKCTEKQKTITFRSIKRLKKEYPKVWAQLQNEWDPDGSLTAKFEATNGNRQSGPIPAVSLQLLNTIGTDHDSNKGDDTVIKKLSSTSTTTPVPTTPKKAAEPTKKFENVSSKDNSIVIKEIISTTTSIPTTAKDAVVPTKKSGYKGDKPSSVTKKIRTSTERVTIVSKIITNSPLVASTITNYYAPPIRFRPLANIGAGIEATVSLGTNIVGNLVRGIGALGDRVVETGAEIAGVVLKSITRPL